MAAKRIAVLGFSLESNRFAPPCGEADFRERSFLVGEEICLDARAEHPAHDLSLTGFYADMDTICGGAAGWQAVPIRFIASMPAGPVEEAFFKDFLENCRRDLAAAQPVDGVYICEHGGAIATHTHDPDGDMFTMVREVVGSSVPIVATLDLHCNISDEMENAVDLMIGYRTNPHVDLYERGVEAAGALREMMAGLRPKSYRVRLPLVAPSVTQLTADGYPYGDLIKRGQAMIDDEIMNVSAVTGFAFADTPKNGLTVVVTARNDAARAKQVAIELAESAWRDRERYRPRMISVDEAAAKACAAGADASAPALLFADPADNPGGGGRGNTTYILAAFHAAGVTGCALSPFFDAPLVARAMAAGEGAVIEAAFNTGETQELSLPFTAEARVRGLFDGAFIGTEGMAAGKSMNTGPTAVLEVGGVTVVVVSQRQQALSSDYFSVFGIDPTAMRSLVVKSRGHFRAGFGHLFDPARIHEVDVLGLTSPVLARFDWRYLPRPVFPLDEDATWSPPM